MEVEWEAYQQRHQIPRVHDGWVQHPLHVVGWNPQKAISSVEVELPMCVDQCEDFKTANEAYKQWCDIYHHWELRTRSQFASEQEINSNLPIRAKEEMTKIESTETSPTERAILLNTKLESEGKYSNNDISLNALAGLKDNYAFDLEHEKRWHEKEKVELQRTTLKKSTKVKKQPTQSTAAANWMKIQAHTRLTMLQDYLIPSKEAGSSYTDYKLPFASLPKFVPYNYNVIDDRVAELQFSSLPTNTIAALASHITKPYDTISWRCSEEQQAHYSLRAIYKFITTNFQAVTSGSVEPTDVLSKKEGNPQGMANLLRDMIESLGYSITAKTVDGISPSVVSAVGHPTTHLDIYWNLVSFNGSSYLIDIWSAIKESSDFYWMTPPNLFFTTHCPNDPDMQLAMQAVHQSAWEVSPVLSCNAHTHGLSLSSHVKYIHIASKAPPLTITYGLSDHRVIVTSKLYEGAIASADKNLLPGGYVWQTRSRSECTVTFTLVLPDTGLYTFEVWVTRDPQQEAVFATNYQLSSSIKVGDDALLPVQDICPLKAIITQPKGGKLVADSQQLFEVFPTSAAIEGVVLCQRIRPETQSRSKGTPPQQNIEKSSSDPSEWPCEYTVLDYNPFIGVYRTLIPSLKRGIVDLYVRIGGEFIPAFTKFSVVLAISSKEEELNGGLPLIPDSLTSQERSAISKLLHSKDPNPVTCYEPLNSMRFRKVGEYFEGTTG